MHHRIMTACIVSAALAQCAAAQVTVYESDFEGTDGGWVNSGTGTHPGDWQYEANYDASLYSGAYVPPASAASGTGMWGTTMYGDYANADEFNILSQTFDFSAYAQVALEFASWSNVFSTFDRSEVWVNGTILAGTSGSTAPQVLSNNNGSTGSTWVTEMIDLSAYDGQASVTIEFRMFATSVVNRAGWYIDDVSITAIPTPGVAMLLGMGSLVALRRRR